MSDAVTATAPSAPRWPRVLLFIAALIELSQGLGSLPILAGNLDEIPGPGIGGKIIIAAIVILMLIGIGVIFIVRARYALIARELNHRSDPAMGFKQTVLNRIAREAEDAYRRGTTDINTQAIIEKNFQRHLNLPQKYRPFYIY